jgi:hypothetical protein
MGNSPSTNEGFPGHESMSHSNDAMDINSVANSESVIAMGTNLTKAIVLPGNRKLVGNRQYRQMLETYYKEYLEANEHKNDNRKAEIEDLFLEKFSFLNKDNNQLCVTEARKKINAGMRDKIYTAKRKSLDESPVHLAWADKEKPYDSTQLRKLHAYIDGENANLWDHGNQKMQSMSTYYILL